MVSKEKRAEYNKRYYSKHKKSVMDYLKAKIVCPCGSKISRVNLKTHQRTKKHTRLLAALSQNQNPIRQTD